ncbi:cytochrome c biogenesis protein CcdA [Candidatus Uhrbacteria bacterium]|nr:cytochrome c biogenesis protein CcdA [Candidatus Uhrbacteria bacterium]
MIQFLFALLAGVVTIAGPCILPLLPIILGNSTVRSHQSRPLFIVLGFVLSFSLFAVIFAVFGQIFGVSADIFRTIGTVIIGLFGLIMLFPRIQESLFTTLQPLLTMVMPRIHQEYSGLWSGFLLGASLGLVWTPCAGPVLGSILTLVASKQNLAQAGSLLFAYALGAGLPMLLIAYGGQAATSKVRALSKYTVTLQRVFGLIVILVAICIYTGLDREVQTWLIVHMPWLFPNLSFNL